MLAPRLTHLDAEMENEACMSSSNSEGKLSISMSGANLESLEYDVSPDVQVSTHFGQDSAMIDVST